MNRRMVAAGVVVVAILAVLVWLAPPAGTRSARDVTPLGYRLAAAWLAERGDVIYRETAELPPVDSTLVIAWPLATEISDAPGLSAWVSRGGRLLLLLDGSPPNEFLDSTFGVTVPEEAPVPPWDHAEWSAWEDTRRHATTATGRIELGRPSFLLTCPATAEILARGEDGETRACRIPRGDGEVIVSYASLWQNSALGAADNLAFLDQVLGGRSVAFDEYHHQVDGAVGGVPAVVPAALLLQLVALWLLGAVTLARRFGDPLPPPAIPGPSMARALHALATLHRGAGHAPAAAARLYALANARAARAGIPLEALPAPPTDPSDEAFARWAGQLTKGLERA